MFPLFIILKDLQLTIIKRVGQILWHKKQMEDATLGDKLALFISKYGNIRLILNTVLRFEEMNIEIQLSDELAGSLRKLKVSWFSNKYFLRSEFLSFKFKKKICSACETKKTQFAGTIYFANGFV